MAKKVKSYIEVYNHIKQYGRDSAVKVFGISEATASYITCIGDEFMAENHPVPNAKTIDKYSPRELMTELANRGYRGKLSYTQTIDIANF